MRGRAIVGSTHLEQLVQPPLRRESHAGSPAGQGEAAHLGQKVAEVILTVHRGPSESPHAHSVPQAGQVLEAGHVWDDDGQATQACC